jgi:hypothetical protein
VVAVAEVAAGAHTAEGAAGAHTANIADSAAVKGQALPCWDQVQAGLHTRQRGRSEEVGEAVVELDLGRLHRGQGRHRIHQKDRSAQEEPEEELGHHTHQKDRLPEEEPPAEELGHHTHQKDRLPEEEPPEEQEHRILQIDHWLAARGHRILQIDHWLAARGRRILQMNHWLAARGRRILQMNHWLAALGRHIPQIGQVERVEKAGFEKATEALLAVQWEAGRHSHRNHFLVEGEVQTCHSSEEQIEEGARPSTEAEEGRHSHRNHFLVEGEALPCHSFEEHIEEGVPPWAGRSQKAIPFHTEAALAAVPCQLHIRSG